PLPQARNRAAVALGLPPALFPWVNSQPKSACAHETHHRCFVPGAGDLFECAGWELAAMARAECQWRDGGEGLSHFMEHELKRCVAHGFAGGGKLFADHLEGSRVCNPGDRKAAR